MSERSCTFPIQTLSPRLKRMYIFFSEQAEKMGEPRKGSMRQEYEDIANVCQRIYGTISMLPQEGTVTIPWEEAVLIADGWRIIT